MSTSFLVYISPAVRGRRLLFTVLLCLASWSLPPVAGQAQPASSEAADALPWWNHTVFYQVFVRSFADASTGTLSCDGIGDLQGLIERLDYLNDGDPNTTDDLGVTGLWLMPIMQSPSYHGYDVVDYYTIEEDYGTNDDFKRLIDAAHARGIRVIIDLVLNHSSDAHPWFAEATGLAEKYRDWYIWSPERKDYAGPWGQQVWHPREGAWYYGIFGPHMPDLNYRNPEVTKAAHDISRFWLEEMGADGFRLDAIRHIIEDGPVQENTPATHEWLRDYRDFYRGVDPEVMAVGEVWSATEDIAPYVTDGELDLAFEFDLAGAILDAVDRGSAAALRAQQQKTEDHFPPNQYATFLRNHDQSRVMTVLNGEVDKAKSAVTILLTSPGVPFLYYGEEIGMVGPKPDPKIHTPMQWGPGLHADFTECQPWQDVNGGYQEVNVETEAAAPHSLLNLYRRLIHLRHAHPALQAGDYVPVHAEHNAVYAFLRQGADETLLVVVNVGGEPVHTYALSVDEAGLTASKQAEEVLHDVDVTSPQLNAQGGFSEYVPLSELAPRTGYVIQLR